MEAMYSRERQMCPVRALCFRISPPLRSGISASAFAATMARCAACADKQPYGLEMDPQRLRAHLEAHVGKKEADLITVAPGSQGERTDLGETSRHDVGKSDAADRKEQRLRAILRAPEVVQDLYKAGLLTQQEAAKLGPKSPTPEQAGRRTNKVNYPPIFSA